MENKMMTIIIIVIALIGLISIGYLIVKITMLIKEYKSAKRMFNSSPNFNIGKLGLSDEIKFSENESTIFLKDNCSFASLQFLEIAGNPSTRIELLDKKNIILGRDPDVDILIEDHAISRKHLKLVFTDNKLQIQDLGTTNGTILDGVRLTSMSLVPVLNGSIVTIGTTRFSIHIV